MLTAIVGWTLNKNNKTAEAEPSIDLSNYVTNISLNDLDGNPVSEIEIGVPQLIDIEFSIPEDITAETLTFAVDSRIQFEQAFVEIMNQNNEVFGSVIPNNNVLTVHLTQNIPANSLLHIESPHILNEDTTAGMITLDFTDSISKTIKALPAPVGSFAWYYQANTTNQNDNFLPSTPTLSTDYKWITSLPAYKFGWGFKKRQNEILANNPNYKGGFENTVAYYYYATNANNTPLSDPLLNICIDPMHNMLQNTDIPYTYANLEDIIFEENVDNIYLALQIGILKSVENGLILSGGTLESPFNASNDTQEQYLAASAIVAQMNALKGNLNPSYRLANLSYEDFSPNYPETLDYVNVIEKIMDLYKNVAYMSDDSLLVDESETLNLVTVPSNQQLFTHYIDEASSENLDLLSGIKNTDYTNFKQLSIKPNQNFNGKEVKINLVKRIDTPVSYDLKNTLLARERNQAKTLLALPSKYYLKTTITLTMNPEQKINIQVEKQWNDANNQDGKRPNSINVELYADNAPTGKVETLTENNHWQTTWTDLDEKKAGQLISYTVKELTTTDGYTLDEQRNDAENILLINTYTPEQTTISGTKKWDDQNNQDGKRPSSITVQLLANGRPTATQQVSEATHWQYAFNDLPKYDQGKLIDYTELEDDVDQYTTSYTGTTITNSYTPGKTGLTVVKVWNDANNQDGKRPNSINVELYADNAPTGKVETLTENNHWQTTWTDLDEKKAGQLISYTVKELTTTDGYTLDEQRNDAENILLINTYTPEQTTISGTKKWDDQNNQDGKRPSSITVQLLANGRPTATQQVSEATHWQYAFNDLPKYDQGKLIDYTVLEDDVDQYTTSYTGTTITNSYTPGKTGLTVVKVWNDANNQDGKRPNSINVELYADNAPTGKVETLTENNHWQTTWTDLDEKKAGQLISYTVKELTTTDGYTLDEQRNDAENILLINTYTPEQTTISGTKKWDDQNNQDGKRPSSITVQLLANGRPTATQQVSEATHWQYAFNDLPKYDQGKLIDYTELEDDVDQYTTSYTGTTITNSYTPGKTGLTVVKVWNDANNQDGKRPNSINVELYADNAPTGKVETLTENNHWQTTWTDLDEKKAGQLISYTVKELTTTDGYTLDEQRNDAENILLINTYTPEQTTISGTKKWDDQNNQDGKRPSSITVQLLANGRPTATQQVSEATHWQYAFNDLPKYDQGKLIDYTVLEDDVDQYTTSYTGTTITNSYTPGKTGLTVVKVWNDANNQDGKRSNSINVELYADNAPTGKVETLTENNHWQTTWTDLDEKKAGQPISYTVKELSIPNDYNVNINKYSLGNVIITNSYTSNSSIDNATHENDLSNLGETTKSIYILIGIILAMGIIIFIVYIKVKK